jgi:hypothetical protein
MTPRQGGPPAALPIALAALVALVLGAIAGAGIQRASEGRTSPPSASLPAGFPGGDSRYLEGVGVAELRQRLQKVGYQCETASPPQEGGATRRLHCADARHLTFVDIDSDDDSHVRQLQSTCHAPPLAPADFCKNLSTSTAGAAFPAQSELVAQARTWATENWKSDSRTTIAGVTLVAALEPGSMMTAARAG